MSFRFQDVVHFLLYLLMIVAIQILFIMTFCNNDNLFSNLPCPDWMQSPSKFLKGAPPRGRTLFNHVVKFIGPKESFKWQNVHLPQEWFGTPKWPSFHCSGTQRVRSIGNLDLDFKIRISDLQSNTKSENGFQRWDICFWIFIFTVRLGNPKKDLKNCP